MRNGHRHPLAGDARALDRLTAWRLRPVDRMNVALERVREGAPVYDRSGERIGTVRDVYLGSEPGAATTARPPLEAHSFLDDLLQVLAPPAVPDVVRERLLREGFVRIDASGPLAADRVAFASQVRSVTEAGVVLDAGLDELLRR